MSNIETVSLASTSPNSTFHTGLSVAASLYSNVTLFLKGDLGAGKTTFVQGLGAGLGISDPIVSPTFALENRYGEKLLHMDLFRIDPKEARRLLEASDDFPGVRAVEWSERAMTQDAMRVPLRSPDAEQREAEGGLEGSRSAPHIIVSLTDPSPTTRTIDMTFADLPLPDTKTIEQWRNDVKLPPHIRLHCDAVAAFAKKCAETLITRGIVARPHAVYIGALLHDLLRFVDFLNVEDRKMHPEWVAIAEKYQTTHEETCARFVAERGYPELGLIIRPHGLRTLDEEGAIHTIEQKILFYADKRVMGDKVVSLKERFDDFVVRYGKGTESEEAKRWRRKMQ